MEIPKKLRFWYFKTRFNLFPPYLLSRTRCVYVAPDYRHARFQLSLSWLNRNLNGSLFGGSLYAMVDPVHAVMLEQLLPGRHVVWAKSAKIDFLKPGRGRVVADYRISDEALAAITAELAAKGKAEATFPVAIGDAEGDTVARADVTVYVRRRGAAAARARD
jgi:acyl-coenzyme A thioesterase PaaI-like protein